MKKENKSEQTDSKFRFYYEVVLFIAAGFIGSYLIHTWVIS